MSFRERFMSHRGQVLNPTGMIEGSLNSDRCSIITRQEGRLTRTERDREMMSRSESGREEKKPD